MYYIICAVLWLAVLTGLTIWLRRPVREPKPAPDLSSVSGGDAFSPALARRGEHIDFLKLIAGFLIPVCLPLLLTAFQQRRILAALPEDTVCRGIGAVPSLVFLTAGFVAGLPAALLWMVRADEGKNARMHRPDPLSGIPRKGVRWFCAVTWAVALPVLMISGNCYDALTDRTILHKSAFSLHPATYTCGQIADTALTRSAQGITRARITLEDGVTVTLTVRDGDGDCDGDTLAAWIAANAPPADKEHIRKREKPESDALRLFSFTSHRHCSLRYLLRISVGLV